MRGFRLLLVILLIVALGFGEIHSEDLEKNSGKGRGLGSRMRKFLKLKQGSGRLNLKSLIKSKKEKHEKTLEELLLELEDNINKRRKTKNPFLKLRCYLNEQKIKKAINKIKKSEEEEKKLEVLDEELPMDYSPQALPGEGGIPPYLPVLLETHEKPVTDYDKFGEKVPEEKGELGDKDETEDGAESADELLEESGSGEDVDALEGTNVGESETEDGIEVADGLEENEGEEIETIVTEDEERGQKDNNLEDIQQGEKLRRKTKKRTFIDVLRNIFGIRKKSRSSRLKKLLDDSEKFDEELSKTRNPLRRRYLKHMLKKNNREIKRLTEEVVDEIEGQEGSANNIELNDKENIENDQ
ncbi:hypothetical protein FG386_002453 [Cryptosporidium ryanae]|uniref:uncharacterized protein n=1 Tax=Cryptosporidium ryanae TaxID=515981 RepID=UPI00351A57DE|nr:hypothetical protein FG386_002453 [Cryptosporidium ryanae]